MSVFVVVVTVVFLRRIIQQYNPGACLACFAAAFLVYLDFFFFSGGDLPVTLGL